MAWGAKLLQMHMSATTCGMGQGPLRPFLWSTVCTTWPTMSTGNHTPLIRSTRDIAGSVKKLSQKPVNQLVAIIIILIGIALLYF